MASVIAVIGKSGTRCLEHAIEDYQITREWLVTFEDDCIAHVVSLGVNKGTVDATTVTWGFVAIEKARQFYPNGLYCSHSWNGDTCGKELLKRLEESELTQHSWSDFGGY